MSNAPSTNKGLNKILSKIAERTQSEQPILPFDAGTPSPSASEQQPVKEPARIHPDKRGQVMLSNHLAELRGETSQEEPAISYYSPELIQCTLPHSKPKTPVWVRKNGHFSLIVTSGANSDGEFLGVPYGSFPRLTLAYIITQVVAKRERRIELSSHFSTFLKGIGYSGNLRGDILPARRVKEQLHRLLNARITFEYKEGNTFKGRHAVRNVDIAPKFDLWWDFKQPEQGSFFGSWIELSEDFYNAIVNNPVPLRTDVLKALKKSPLAIDVYMWASYRLFSMQSKKTDQLHVTYGQLHAQFGTGIAEENYRKFRQELKFAFKKVATYWKSPHSTSESLLNFEFTNDGLTLYSSPLLVSRGNRQTNAELNQKILADRCFDEATRKKARIIAGHLSVIRLEADYWAWIEKRNFTPQNPVANFLSFIKKHRRLNGEAI